MTLLPKGFPVDAKIMIYRNPMHGMNPPRPKEARIRTLEIKRQITLITQSTIPHPLVEQTRMILTGCIPDKDSIMDAPKRVCLDLQVSSGSLDRALVIMDSIIKALEGFGHKVLIRAEGTLAVVSGFEIPFSMTEELKRRHIEPQEHSLDGYYQFGHSLFSEKRVPTGNLRLTLHPPSWTNARKKWRDTENQKLEDSLTSFIRGLLSIAARSSKATVPSEQ